MELHNPPISQPLWDLLVQIIIIDLGSGKTTLLNILSGRTHSPNLNCVGEIMINGDLVKDFEEYSNQFAYVMQDDVLLPTMTPRGIRLWLNYRKFLIYCGY